MLEIKFIVCFVFLLFLNNVVSMDVNDTYKPCDPYNPKVPDFSGHGRRLSAIKCYEYIWDIKNRKDIATRKMDCLRLQGVFIAASIGGRDTSTGEFPHMVAIGWSSTDPQKRWIFKCGGTLISENFVLTAGHCARAPEDSAIADSIPKNVRLGNKNLGDDQVHKDVAIKRIITHPQYRPPKKYFDLALMEIEGPITFSFVTHPACLLQANDIKRLGNKATATGWGVTKYGGSTTLELQAVHIDILDSSLCDNYLSDFYNRNWCGIQDHQICAANITGGVDTCEGDSGGPLQLVLPLPSSINEQMHGIVGVTSFGFKCALANSPGVYTKVSYFLNWIEDIVWKKKN